MGRVTRVTERGVVIEPSEAHKIAPLKPGDGVVFDAADWRSPEEAEEGGRIFEIENHELRFGNGAIQPGRIRQGDLVWRTNDPDVDKAARVYTGAASPVSKQPVHIRAAAREGERLRSEWSVGRARVTVESDVPLGAARNRGVDAEYLRAQFGRLGNTPYELAGLDLDVEGAPFAPASMLNAMRREAVEKLQAVSAVGHRISSSVLPLPTRTPAPRSIADPTLHLLIRTPEQLTAAIELRPTSITLDYLDLYGLRPSIEEVRQAGIAVRVAAPRVLKPGEEKIVDFLVGCDCPILVRSTGLLEALSGRPHRELTGDFSLNAANTLTAEELFTSGVTILAPTHDLNAAQVADLARQVGADRIEAVAYQHLPVFHTEHCVFARFLSNGKSYLDCGRPCEAHRIALRDTAGRAHPVLADVGCRNTVFGAESQEAGLHLMEWRAAGISRFRLEFAHESPQQVVGVTRAFEDALAGFLTGRELTDRLRKLTPQGVTEGSLFVPPDYLTLPVLQ
jgi:putative protease